MSVPEEQSSKIAGYKATLSNPNVSDEAKENARQILDNELQGGDAGTGAVVRDNEQKNPGNVAGGLKAAINNPNVTEEGKRAAQEKLDSL
ncbi:MAG: hypothetical protein LQ342_000972 [Letrouitia transgressa]|nr:MAG: hypothetical protein LQ342_000972 [Letrouitia transgressa]